jgi:hypothetical protein
MTKFKKTYYKLGAMMTLGVITNFSDTAMAAGNDFSKISRNITTSIQDIPGFLSAISYMIGVGLGVLGILKIKAHVEGPQNAKLQDGVIRLAAGGALFALPIVYEAMFTTVGEGAAVGSAKLKKVSFDTE